MNTSIIQEHIKPSPPVYEKVAVGGLYIISIAFAVWVLLRTLEATKDLLLSILFGFIGGFVALGAIFYSGVLLYSAVSFIMS